MSSLDRLWLRWKDVKNRHLGNLLNKQVRRIPQSNMQKVPHQMKYGGMCLMCDTGIYAIARCCAINDSFFICIRHYLGVPEHLHRYIKILIELSNYFIQVVHIAYQQFSLHTNYAITKTQNLCKAHIAICNTQ